jgi:hypothetical protein
MNRPLSWLIVLGLTVGISACDKKEGVPLPKTDAGEVKQQAKEPVGAVEKRSRIRFIDAIGQGAMLILHVIERRSGAI